MARVRISALLSFGSMLLVSSVCGALVACSGSTVDAPSTFVDPAPDAGPPPSSDGPTLAQNLPDAGPSDASCPPTTVPASFTPTWRPPNAQHSGACSAQQMSDFYDACLTPPVDPATCAAYTQKNGTCAACLATDDTATSLGPVIWHQQRTFFTINVAGCIANEQADTSKTSCGAAYQGLLECKEVACNTCFSTPGATFHAFSVCENQAAPECTSFADTMHTTCGDAIHDGGASRCLPPPATTSAKTVFQIVAPLFCGQ
jgi:hypothetical protein